MTSIFIARRGAQRVRASQSVLQASRALRVVGAADTLYRAQGALAGLDPDALLLDLRLEDGAALSLVRALRGRHLSRPRIMLVTGSASDPLLFATLRGGADAYLLESDLSAAASALSRLAAGEATMGASIAAQVLQFFNEPVAAAPRATAPDERGLDWTAHASNPMRLSAGECWMLRTLATGMRPAEVALRMAVSAEVLGRRIGNVYRKLNWDLRSGSLSLRAA